MILKKFLKLFLSDTKIKVIFAYDLVIKPCDYPKYEDLKVVELRLNDGEGTLRVYISADGFYYNTKKNKYVKY